MSATEGNLRVIGRWCDMESRNQTGQTQNAASRARAIMPPTRHDGIGNALRVVYDPATASIPDDMKSLLARLG